MVKGPYPLVEVRPKEQGRQKENWPKRDLMNVRENLVPPFNKTVDDESDDGAENARADQQDRVLGNRKHGFHGRSLSDRRVY